MKEEIEKAAEEIRRGGRFFVTTHQNPEGDALGAALALYHAFRSAGKEVVLYNKDRVPYSLEFLQGSREIVHQIPSSEKFDAIFVVDCGDMKLVGEEFQRFRAGKIVVNIDHHRTNTRYGEINVVDPKASASGEVVYRILKAVPLEISPWVAECIYTSLYTDTGGFHYSNTTAEALEIAADTVRAGAEPGRIVQELYDSHPRERLDLLRRVLATLEVRNRGEVASIYITEEMFRETGTSKEHTEGFVGYPRSIRGVEIAFSLREVREGEWRISFRSKGKYDVSELAARFEGGGHHNAAGGDVNGSLDEVKQKIYSAIDELMGLS